MAYDTLIDSMYPPESPEEAAKRAQVRAAIREAMAENPDLKFGEAPPPDASSTPPSFEDEARKRGEEALARQEQRQKDVRLADAILADQGYGDDEITAMSQEERLRASGIVVTDAERRQKEIERENERLRNDPAALEVALRDRERDRFEQTAYQLTPQRRAEKAAELGFTADELAQIERHWADRFTTK
jgi:hypothetical protein